MATGMSPGKEFYERQVSLLEAGDIDGLMGHYHEDAEILGFDFFVRGHEAIRSHFERYLQRLGSFKRKSTDRFTESADAIFFEATIVTGLGEVRAMNALVLRDGKATHHFTGVIAISPIRGE